MGAIPTQSGDVFSSVILGIAHELNNPNTFIRVNATTLKKMLLLVRPMVLALESQDPTLKVGPYKPADAIIKMVQLSESILDASVRLISIADKLKQCTSTNLQETSNISLQSILGQLQNQHQFLFKRIKTVAANYNPDETYVIKGHSLEIDQALSILVTNAIDAITSRYGDKSENEGTFEIKLSQKDQMFCLEFIDNGCGMDSETQSKVFDPYFSTKPQGTGDGIGLTLCKAIIEKHGGSISVSSQKNVGSTFTIWLPVLKEQK